MKKVKFLLLLCAISFLLTGCVKFNANMDIKVDKSMDFSIIYAFDTTVFGDQVAINDDDTAELVEKGFTVEDYEDDNMKGVTISRKIKNIDYVSTSDDTKFSLSGILDEEKSKDEYVFKVKKGLFKNKYIANFTFDTADSDLSSSSNASDDSTEDFRWSDYINDSDNYDFDINDDAENGDYSALLSSMDLSFNVTLPFPAKSSNATKKSENGKELKWNLTSTGVDSIQFEFELYNIGVIFGVVLAIVLLVAVVVFILKKGSNSLQAAMATSNGQFIPQAQPNVNQQVQPGFVPQAQPNVNQQMQPGFVSQAQPNVDQQIQAGFNPQVQPGNPQVQPDINQQVQPQNNNPFNNGTM